MDRRESPRQHHIPDDPDIDANLADIASEPDRKLHAPDQNRPANTNRHLHHANTNNDKRCASTRINPRNCHHQHWPDPDRRSQQR